VIDDELLQELLAKATGLYNSGEYRAAIDAWKEALGVDPSSQKAQEGIQMATLLLGDWEPAAAIAETPRGSTPPSSASRPADGAPAVPKDLTPDQIATRLDQGATRVRTLLRQRRYSEAVEGARSLVPIDPDSEEVQRLLEEAQQAFEAAPFIEEHLTLARELGAQERLEEAEAECKKVFALDPTNPDGHVLLMELRTRRASEVRSHPAAHGDPVASGMTMRIDATQLKGIQRTPGAAAQTRAAAPEPVVMEEPEAEPVAEAPEAEAAPPTAETLPDELFDFDPSALDAAAKEPAAHALPLSEPGPEDELVVQGLGGDAGVPGADTAQAAADAVADDAGPANDAAPADNAGAADGQEPADGAEPPADDVHVIDDAEDNYVDAATVVPPAVRLVDRKGAPGPSVETLMDKLGDLEEIPLARPAAKPSAANAKPSAPTPGSWEQELTDLNRKTGQHDIVGRSAAKAPERKAEPDEDVDLSALLGDELGDEPGTPVGAAHQGPEAAHEEAPSIPLDMPEPAPAAADAAGDLEPGAMPDVAGEPPAGEEEPATPPAEGRSRSNLPIYFALLGVLILAIGAGVWWFFFQPHAASGQVPPASTAPPPSSRSRTPGSEDALPTPIGSTSRQPAQQHTAPTAAPGAGSTPVAGDSTAGAPPPTTQGAPSATGTPASQGAAPVAAPPAGAAGGRAASAAAGAAGSASPAPRAAPSAGGTAAGAAAPAPSAPPAPRSLEEVKRESARHMAEGKRLMALEKWQEAHSEFASVLALDPMSFESRELLDKTQVKIDQDLKVRKDLDEARHAFEDKDYQGALWKLYRLPHDPRLGDIDLRIRNAWFNWAVVGLKGGDAVDAKQKLTEVLQADPGDADARKMMEVAERYAARQKDRTFYSFVDTLRFRTFDQK
jgi:tetratricopeptide (TPR) repeat protein